MQNECSQQITRRFFEALRVLISQRKLRGINTFTTRYGINRRNFTELERDPSREMFKTDWLAILVRDFNVNPFWLLCGSGDMFIDGFIRDVAAAVSLHLTPQNQPPEKC